MGLESRQKRSGIPYRKGEPSANIRYNTLGAAWPWPDDVKYGLIGYGMLKDGENNKIRRFPTPIHGAAANFDLFGAKYEGMTFKSAMRKWRGSLSLAPKDDNLDGSISKQFFGQS